MKVSVILCSLVVFLTASRALADWCTMTSSVAASNQHHRVDGQCNGTNWNYVLTDLKTGEKLTGPLPKIGDHPHLYFFLSQDGMRFAVLNANAGIRLNDCFMIFTAKGQLVASLGRNDILTKDEQAEVRSSTNHTSWLNGVNEYDSDMKIVAQSCGRYLPNANAVLLMTQSDREVLISLTDGKVIRKDK